MKQSELLQRQVEIARVENEELNQRQRAKGRHLLIDDDEMINAYATYIDSGEHYPKEPERGIWFPEQIRRLTGGFKDEANALNVELRHQFARACYDPDRPNYGCPNWRTRGW